MARAKKPDVTTLNIDVDAWLRTRDQFVNGLSTLQDAIQTLSTAYVKHTNTVLIEHGLGVDVGSALAKLGENPLFTFGELRPASPPKSAPVDTSGDKKERKKRQHDPNAPKRPLTPFFLYMQTARPIIAADLGADVAKGAVSTEGTRRWGAMNPDDKQLWTNAYKDNLRLYNARMHSYKAGNALAKDMTDQDAAQYADTNNISNDASADAQVLNEQHNSNSIHASMPVALHDEDADGEPEPEKEPSPPPKTPKGKSRKGKVTKATPATSTPAIAAPETIIPPASASSIVPGKVDKKDSPDKKRKRAGKKSEEVVVEKEDMAIETPKSLPKSRKKAKKGE